jgi:Fic family protein
MASHLINEDPLSVTIIKEIHADLTDRLQYDKGQFKKSENMIIGPSSKPLLV